MQNFKFPIMLSVLTLGAIPAHAQVSTEAAARIEAPAEVRVVEDMPTRLLISQSGITFAISSSESGSAIGMAGFVDAGATGPTQISLDSAKEWAMTGTTLNNDVLSVSIGSPGELNVLHGDGAEGTEKDSSLTVVLAQYN